jgi:hypothetical protein
MSAGRRKHVNHGGFGTLEHSRQVADHAAGSLGQSQLDRPVELFDDVIERTGNLKDHQLTDDP